MNHNVYLPDDISAKAKEAGLNLSRLLRDAVTDELERSDAMSETLTDTQAYMLDLEDADGRLYEGRLIGKLIANDYPVSVFLVDDERVILYSQDKTEMTELNDPESELRDVLGPGLYVEAMHALGIKPVIDI